MYFTQLEILWKVFAESPKAVARIWGGDKYPLLKGIVQFYELSQSILIVMEVMNLPHTLESCKNGVFGVHIHEGSECVGMGENPFTDTRMHFNPDKCGHPYHAGDMPPLFENDGYALCAFVTDRFRLSDVIGKIVVVHGKRDDFTTQPSGDSGTKIACGVIEAIV